MDWLAMHTVRQRQRELLRDAQRRRVAHRSRVRPSGVRRRIARMTTGFGEFFVRLGNALE